MKRHLQFPIIRSFFIKAISTFVLLVMILSLKISAQVAGDFRSVNSGNWNTSTTWERFTGTVWEASGIGVNNPGQIPSSANSVFLQSGFEVLIDAPAFCNDMNLNAGGTLNAGSQSADVNGNWNNNGNFVPGTSTVTFNGANQTLGGSIQTNFNHLVVNTSVTALLAQDIFIGGNLNSNVGTFKTETFNITVNGLTTVSGTGSIKDAGAGAKLYNGGININGGSFVSTVPISIPSTGIFSISLGNLQINAGTNSFTIAAGVPTTISGGNISISATSTLNFNNVVSMSGGTITGNGALVIAAPFNMDGGTLNGAGTSTITSPNALTITGTTAIITRNLTTPTLIWSSGDFTIGSGATLSATNVLINSSGSINGNGTLSVTGVGASLTKSSASTSTINSVCNVISPATMNLTQGTLVFGGGGTFSSASSVSTSTSLNFAVGTYSFNSPALLTGNGNLLVNGGNITFNIPIGLSNSSSIALTGGTLTLAGASTLLPPINVSAGTIVMTSATTIAAPFTVTGGTINTTAPITLSNPSIFNFQAGTLNVNAGTGVFSIPSDVNTTISGGTINIATGQTLNFLGIVNMSAGTISGAGSLTSTNNFNWTGGTLTGTGSTTISSPGFLSINGNVALSRLLNLTTSMNWLSGNIAMTGATSFNISNGALASFSSSGVISSGGSGSTISLSGVGTMLQKTGAVTTTINPTLNISSPAAISIDNGPLVLGGGGAITGNMTLNNAATVQFSAGTFSVNTPSSISGIGSLLVSGATVSCNTALAISSSSAISISAGTLTLGAASTISPPLTLSGGTLAVNAATSFFNPLLINGGTMTTTAAVNLLNTSSFTLQSGTLNINAGSGTFSVPSPVVSNISGGTISVASSQAANFSGPTNMSGGSVNGVGSFNVNGVFVMSGGSMSGNGTTTISAPGSLTISGNVSLSRTVNANNLNWSSGNISLTSGALTVSGAIAASSAGIISGSGTLTGASFTKSDIAITTINSALTINGNASVNAGTLVLGANSSITGNMSIAVNAKARISNGKVVNAQTLTLGGNGSVAGTWGSTTTAATNKNDTYFDLGTTGVASISVNTCITPIANISAPTTLLSCLNTSINLTATGSGFYFWDNGATTSVRNINSIGTYTLTLSSNGCGISVTSISITQDTITPLVNAIGGNFTKTCVSNINGSMIGETPEVGYSYSWVPSTGLSNSAIANPIANPSITTVYTVTKTKIITGCSATKTISVTVNTTSPIVTAGNAFTKSCVNNISGATIGEENDITASYAWSPSIGLSASNISNPFANPSTTTTYTVTKTTLINGCASSNNVLVTVNTTAPLVSAGNSFTKTCLLNPLGASIGEINDMNASYLWTPSTGLNSTSVSNPFANPSATTTYTVTKTNLTNGCASSANVLISVDTTMPSLQLSSTTSSVCVGSPVTLTATGANSYVWMPGVLSGSEVTISPTQTTTYTVTGTNTTSGCTATSQIIISALALPSVNTSISSSVICVGSPTTLSATGASSYVWQPGGLSGNITIVTPQTSTVYTVTGTDNTTGCIKTSTVSVTVNSLPNVFVTATNSSICSGSSTGLTASGANTYSWQPGNSTSSTLNVIPNATTTYTVTGTNSLTGCISTATKTITVNNCTVTANIKLFIEGYYTGGENMTPVRANEGIGSSLINVDNINIQLHATSFPYLPVASALVMLKTNGTATAIFNNVPPNSYYIGISHRNAIQTWSANPIVTGNGAINYDFTNASSKAFGNNMIEVESGVWAFYSGDNTGDDNVDLLDLNIVELDINDFASGYLETDINGDGNVDLLDTPILEANINNFVFSSHP